MSINFEIKKETTVDGKDYESLADVPPEVRTAILKTLAQLPRRPSGAPRQDRSR